MVDDAEEAYDAHYFYLELQPCEFATFLRILEYLLKQNRKKSFDVSVYNKKG